MPNERGNGSKPTVSVTVEGAKIVVRAEGTNPDTLATAIAEALSAIRSLVVK